MGNLYSSISGGGVKSFKGGSSNVVWNAHLYLDEDNAYYYDDAIYFGDGFVTDDVIAHEWVHGIFIVSICPHCHITQDCHLRRATLRVYGQRVRHADAPILLFYATNTHTTTLPLCHSATITITITITMAITMTMTDIIRRARTQATQPTAVATTMSSSQGRSTRPCQTSSVRRWIF